MAAEMARKGSLKDVGDAVKTGDASANATKAVGRFTIVVGSAERR